ncbi:MAG: hypothetical protein EA398_11690 [Deltaproteobacteria bacterium]|nr:MAG: hypothetical protein EA398_11690 [Deltaproteobacteria bacterium]
MQAEFPRRDVAPGDLRTRLPFARMLLPLLALLMLAACGSDDGDPPESSEEPSSDVIESGSVPGTLADVSGSPSDPSDVDPGTGLPSVNACGGALALVWEGEDADPGDPCGDFSEGTLVCAAGELLRCVGQAALNDCGNAGALPVEIGSACGACAGIDDDFAGTWVCGPDGTPVCAGARDPNACGGCAALDGRPGGLCDGGEGRWVCGSREALDCLGPDANACGGTDQLRFEGQPALPGDGCDAPCGPGILVCSDTTPGALECVATDDALPPNACGGCGSLPARAGDECGLCGGGTWTCDGEGSLRCATPTAPDACGGCTDSTDRPGQPCEVDGIWLCAGSNLTCGTVVRPEDRNACGGAETLSTRPGEACGTCGDGLQVCVSPNEVQCLGGETLNACGGCGPLRGAERQPCGECGSGALACNADNTALECEGDLGAAARNACGRCAELPVDLGDACGTCLEWACGPTGGVRCELNAGLPGCGFATCADLGCAAQNRACIPSDGSRDASCDVCLKGFVERGGACVVDDGGSSDPPVTSAPCLSDGDCDTGQVCDDGQCVPAAGPTTGPPSSAPPTGLDCEEPTPDPCGGVCVNTQTDSAHCGGCGNDCGDFLGCFEGECELCSVPNACNGCGILDGLPGATCGECGEWVCDGREAVVCDDAGFNACGACGILDGTPGTSCGPCDDGELVCSGDGSALTCAGASPSCAWTALSSGARHACAISEAGALYCWGGFDAFTPFGAVLGAGLEQGVPEPVRVLSAEGDAAPFWTDWTHISAGQSHTCGIREDRSLWCWGFGSDGQLGIGEGTGMVVRDRPVRVRAASDSPDEHWSDWTAVSAGRFFTCGIRDGGTLWCWGLGNGGQLGNNATDPVVPLPVQVRASGGGTPWTNWTHIGTAREHACGIREGGTLWCWGRNSNGQLGVGDTAQRNTPAIVLAAEEVGGAPWGDWTMVRTAHTRTCGLREDGALWCWGEGHGGSRGDGSETFERETPSQVIAAEEDGGAPWTDWTGDIAIGDNHTCARRSDGSLWCWGRGTDGQRGVGLEFSGFRRTSPERVAANSRSGDAPWSDWDGVVAGNLHTCGLRDGGTLWCWGAGGRGQRGDGYLNPTGEAGGIITEPIETGEPAEPAEPGPRRLTPFPVIDPIR